MSAQPHEGNRIGLPDDGPGSIAGWGRRLPALLIDWLIASVIAAFIAGGPATGDASFITLVVWLLLTAVSAGFTGASPGQHLLRIRVIRLDRQRLGLAKAAIRTALIALVVPPLVADGDGRGLHDQAVGTAVVIGPTH